MKLIIPVFFETPLELLLSETDQNPGIGGTEFTSIKLALMLALRDRKLDILLVSNSNIKIVKQPSNLQLVSSNFENSWIECFITEKETEIFLLTATIAQMLKKEVLYRNSDKIILWFRHPFQFDFKLFSMKAKASVHVGTYQYYSNKNFYKNNFYIPNIFIPNSSNKAKLISSNGLKLVYVGALVHAKGFHHIAKQWESIKNVHKNITLDIIGSSETYGTAITHPLLPCELSYGDKILKHISIDDINSRKVKFHGNLGGEKFLILKSCDVAILNPTGSSEAFPATPLECLGVGLPVVSCSDFGMKDTMRFFPELVIKKPEEIAAKLTWLLSNKECYSELSTRCLLVSSWFGSQKDLILERWLLLLKYMVFGDEKRNISKNLYPFEKQEEKGLLISFRRLKALAGELKRLLLKIIRIQN